MDGNWGTWSDYSACSVLYSMINVYCVVFCVVDGNWGTWGDYSTCSVSCGGGTQTRTRVCDNPSPSSGGITCPGDSTQSLTCNTDLCPGNAILSV